ncbi:MAG: hypothetical protein KAX65_03125 [Caldilineaceae bacterium]|nr:hypothetical protein [Caldilineaceae bacterium]
MPRGLIKATAYYNNVAAWQDWGAIAAQAEAAGLGDAVVSAKPETGAGYRKVDKAIGKLRAAMTAAGVMAAPLPSSL